MFCMDACMPWQICTRTAGYWKLTQQHGARFPGLHALPDVRGRHQLLDRGWPRCDVHQLSEAPETKDDWLGVAMGVQPKHGDGDIYLGLDYHYAWFGTILEILRNLHRCIFLGVMSAPLLVSCLDTSPWRPEVIGPPPLSIFSPKQKHPRDL